MPREREYLCQMLEAAYDAQELVRGFDCKQFIEDMRTRHAVVNAIQEVGEAARRLLQAAPEYQTEHPEILWSDVISTRNFYVHEYHRINHGEVWRAATESIPALIAQLEPLIPSEE